MDKPDDLLHGVTLKAMLEDLVGRRGWEDLAFHVRIRCFQQDPTIGSSLAFLRRTPWARAKVEALYERDQRKLRRKRKRNAMRKARRRYKASLEAAEE